MSSNTLTLSSLRRLYLDYFAKRGHAIVPSANLVPENDPSTLFTSAGMQAMIPYLLGEKHPQGQRIANSQKCFRSEDIDKVGDNRHTTFFEMLGNWSFGDYFKQEQITFFFEFLVDVLQLDPSRLYVSVFAGNKALNIPKDEESALIWQDLFQKRGIEAKIVDQPQAGLQGGRIFFYGERKKLVVKIWVPATMPLVNLVVLIVSFFMISRQIKPSSFINNLSLLKNHVTLIVIAVAFWKLVTAYLCNTNGQQLAFVN
jgi:alanyl-tRNA synthetase